MPVTKKTQRNLSLRFIASSLLLLLYSCVSFQSSNDTDATSKINSEIKTETKKDEINEKNNPDPSKKRTIDYRKTFVFMIGILSWHDADLSSFPTEGRKDRVLEQAFLNAGVPKSQLVFLEDSIATKITIMRELRAILAKTTSDSNFIFYYAGHGSNDPTFYIANYDMVAGNVSSTVTFREIGTEIRKSFAGELLLYLGDMCFSGGFALEAEQQTTPAIAITSANDKIESTDTWTYTETWIDIINGKNSFDTDKDGGISIKEAGSIVRQNMLLKENQASGYDGNGKVDESLLLQKTK
jgi:hypothetical protein